MRVGLIRHFRVDEPLPTGRLNAAQLHEWQVRYDAASPIVHDARVESDEWARCYSSDLARAVATAQAVYDGEIVQTPLLREATFDRFATGSLVLPVRLWRTILSLAWITGHRSQRAPRDDFQRRVVAVADLVEAQSDDILLVSHGIMMMYLRRELVRRGFVGPKFRIAENARLYVFER